MSGSEIMKNSIPLALDAAATASTASTAATARWRALQKEAYE